MYMFNCFYILICLSCDQVEKSFPVITILQLRTILARIISENNQFCIIGECYLKILHQAYKNHDINGQHIIERRKPY